MTSSTSSTNSPTNKTTDDAPVVERDDRDRATRQARVSEKTGSALKPPATVPPLPGPVSAPSGRAASRQPAHAAPSRSPEALPALLSKSVADGFRKRMRETLATFVDSPDDAVAGADDLYAAAVDQVMEALVRRREELSRQRQGKGGDTEALRQALLQYRTALETVITL